MTDLKKYRVSKATIKDKIYFHKDDLLDVSLNELQYDSFTYLKDGKDFFTTLSYDEDTEIVSVPSGSFFKFKFSSIDDFRPQYGKRNWESKIILHPEQNEVMDSIFSAGDKPFSALIQAPCGWGKTFTAINMIARNGKPTIIIVHTKLLLYQWYEALQKYLTTDTTIGIIGDGKFSIGDVTVALYHTAVNNLEPLRFKFDFMIVDEAHRCMADVFGRVVNHIAARTKIAFTATPFRKDGLHLALPDYFGPNKIVAKDRGQLPVKVKIVRTDIKFPVIDPNRDWSRALNYLSENIEYIELVSRWMDTHIRENRCLLVLNERLVFLDALEEKSKRRIKLVGSTKEDQRTEILLNLGKKYDAVLSTRIFDEGLSAHRLDTLYLTAPMNNNYTLEQRLGRIRREHDEKQPSLLVDFWLQGTHVERQQENRLQWYLDQGFEVEDNNE